MKQEWRGLLPRAMKRADKKGIAMEVEDIKLKIDLLKLHKEWCDQPEFVHAASSHLAKCSETVDKAKANLELTEARISSEVRKFPSNYDLDKVTEASIRSAIVQTEDYQQANLALISAKREEAEAKALCNALENRKKSLENLVVLHGRDYYSEPKAKQQDRPKRRRTYESPKERKTT